MFFLLLFSPFSFKCFWGGGGGGGLGGGRDDGGLDAEWGLWEGTTGRSGGGVARTIEYFAVCVENLVYCLLIDWLKLK